MTQGAIMTIDTNHNIRGSGPVTSAHAAVSEASVVFTRQLMKSMLFKAMQLRSTGRDQAPPSISSAGSVTPGQARIRAGARAAADWKAGPAIELFSNAVPFRSLHLGGGAVLPTTHAALHHARKGNEPAVTRTGARGGRPVLDPATSFVDATDQSGTQTGDESGTMSGSLAQPSSLRNTALQERGRLFEHALKVARGMRISAPSSLGGPRRAGEPANPVSASTPAGNGAFSLASLRRSLARLVGIASL